MKKLLTLFLLLAVTAAGYSQDLIKQHVSTVRENGNQVPNTIIRYGNSFDRGLYPNGTVIPGADNFFDYVTNGNNMSNMWALGDTMVVCYFGADSTDPTGTTSRISYYIVSTDKGVTWGAPLAFTIFPRRSAYPNLYPYIDGVLGRGVSFSGRLYTAPGPGSSRGGAFQEIIFNSGAINSAQCPYDGEDVFGHYQNGSIVGGIFTVTDAITEDSIFYIQYDFSSNTFASTRTVLATPPSDVDSNARYAFTADDSGNDLMAIWWDSQGDAPALRYTRSTDGGTSWGSVTGIQEAFSSNYVIGGDTCGPWFGMDVEYRPGTTEPFVTWSTLYPTGSGLSPGDPQGCKILVWNPSLNGGVPVEVAGRTNMNTIADTNLLFPAISINGGGNNGGLSVGVVPVSHPSIGFGTNGRIFITFSGYQPIPDTLDGFVMNDIYYSYSDDGGATWEDPINLTNTADWDELYPTVSPANNTNEFFVHYQATRGPGCQSFTNTFVPTYRVHEIFDIVVTPVSISNISSEVPETFKLSQNYPNPFNPSTKIQFSVPKTSQLSLKVYDAAGKEVANLINNQEINAGTFEYTFDGSNLSSGVYFYTLSSGDFKQTKKMLLVK